MAEERSGAGHVGADRDGPEAELIVGKQITGEREQQRQNQKNHADVPIELTWLLVRACEKHAEHVEFDGDDHQVRGPAMHVAQQFAKGHVVFEIEHISESLYFAGMVVKHKHDASEREDDEQIKGDATHAPGVAVANGVTINLGRMQMEKNVGEHSERAVARRVVVLVPENRSVNLSLGGLLQNFDLLFGFCRQFCLEGFEVFLDASLQALDQASGFAIFSVRRFLFGHRLLSRSVAARTVAISPCAWNAFAALPVTPANTIPDR